MYAAPATATCTAGHKYGYDVWHKEYIYPEHYGAEKNIGISDSARVRVQGRCGAFRAAP